MFRRGLTSLARRPTLMVRACHPVKPPPPCRVRHAHGRGVPQEPAPTCHPPTTCPPACSPTPPSTWPWSNAVTIGNPCARVSHGRWPYPRGAGARGPRVAHRLPPTPSTRYASPLLTILLSRTREQQHATVATAAAASRSTRPSNIVAISRRAPCVRLPGPHAGSRQLSTTQPPSTVLTPHVARPSRQWRPPRSARVETPRHLAFTSLLDPTRHQARHPLSLGLPQYATCQQRPLPPRV